MKHYMLVMSEEERDALSECISMAIALDDEAEAPRIAVGLMLEAVEISESEYDFEKSRHTPDGQTFEDAYNGDGKEWS